MVVFCLIFAAKFEVTAIQPWVNANVLHCRDALLKREGSDVPC